MIKWDNPWKTCGIKPDTVNTQYMLAFVVIVIIWSYGFLKFVYVFIWLHWVLAVACGFFFFLVVACGVFSCNVWTLSCGMWDLVSWRGSELRPSALGTQSLSHWTTREIIWFRILALPFTSLKSRANYATFLSLCFLINNMQLYRISIRALDTESMVNIVAILKSGNCYTW